MSSVTQITLGVIILGAAFILGHYVNQELADQEASAQNNSTIEETEPIWQKRPAPIQTLSSDNKSQGSFLDLDKQVEVQQDEIPAETQRVTMNKLPTRGKAAELPNVIRDSEKQEVVEPDFTRLLENSIFAQSQLPRTASPDNPVAASTRGPNTGDAARGIDPLLAQNTKNSFSGSDFEPRLKDRFNRRIESLRRANLTPGPDDDTSAANDPRWTLEQNRLKGTDSTARLADQIPINGGIEPVMPRPMPDRDLVTRNQNGSTNEMSNRLVPFRLNEQAVSRLVSVSSNQALQLETDRFSEHRSRNGETLQSISTKYYGKPDFYLDIFVANQDQLRTPADVPQGMLLKIPLFD